jgi:hypothetical protein
VQLANRHQANFENGLELLLRLERLVDADHRRTPDEAALVAAAAAHVADLGYSATVSELVAALDRTATVPQRTARAWPDVAAAVRAMLAVSARRVARLIELERRRQARVA